MERVSPSVSPVPSYAYAQPAAYGSAASNGKANGNPFGHSPHVPSPQQPAYGQPQPMPQTPMASPAASAEKPHWRDLWAAVAFCANTAVYLGVLVLFCVQFPAFVSNMFDASKGTWKQWALGAFVALATSASLCLLALYVMYRFPRQTLHACYVLAVVVFAALAVRFGAAGPEHLHAAVSCGILALLLAVAYYVMRSRLDYSAVVLRSVLDVLRAHPWMLAASGAAALASTLLCSVFFSFVGAFLEATLGAHASGKFKFLLPVVLYMGFSTF